MCKFDAADLASTGPSYPKKGCAFGVLGARQRCSLKKSTLPSSTIGSTIDSRFVPARHFDLEDFLDSIKIIC